MKKKSTVDFFAHWYLVDTGKLMTALVVGNHDAAIKYLRKEGLCRTDDDTEIVRTLLNQGVEGYRPPHDLSACNRTGRTLFDEAGGISIMWFPVVPTDAVLAHEILHCVQDIMRSTGINDDEFAAYTLANLFEHYQEKLKEDLKKHEFKPDSKFISNK